MIDDEGRVLRDPHRTMSNGFRRGRKSVAADRPRKIGKDETMNGALRKACIGVAMALLLGTAGCASATDAANARYRVVITPGPRGSTHIVEVEPETVAASQADAPRCSSQTAQAARPVRPQYRLVTTPGPRGMTRAVRVREARTPCR